MKRIAGGKKALQAIAHIEDLIPHRQTMRLIDTILEVDQDHAVTQATATTGWPLTTADGTSPLILIELAAQTAGVCFGWNELSKPIAQRGEARGWLVGVKSARFHVSAIALASCITIRSETRIIVGQYKEIAASAQIGETPIAEIHLQVLQADKSGFE